MFAGVAAASMPAVKRFFTYKRFSASAWGSSFKSNIGHILSGRKRSTNREEKLDNSKDSKDSDELHDLPSPGNRTNEFSITSQGHMRKATGAHIKLPRNAFITRHQDENITLSRW
jgi:hypothetical protein